MVSDENSNVSLLVPTKDRSEFVERLLNYYADRRFTGRLIIGDSSGPFHRDQTLRAVGRVAACLDVVHLELKGLTIGPCLKELVHQVTTPFAAVLPDDDFIVPTSLAACVRFLQLNEDYACAHGQGVTVILDTNSLSGNVVYCSHYPQPSLEAPSAVERFREHMAGYSVSLFSVHRTESWRVMMDHSDRIEDVPFSAELLPCCLSVVLGKVKNIDGQLYLVRQSHNRRLQLPMMVDWVMSPRFYPGYALTASRLVQELMRCGQVDPETAEEIVKDGFRTYIGLGVGLRRSLGRDDWMLGIARRVWHLLRAIRPIPRSQWDLQALLKESSPYHKDFLPIYRALVARREGLDEANRS